VAGICAYKHYALWTYGQLVVALLGADQQHGENDCSLLATLTHLTSVYRRYSILK